MCGVPRVFDRIYAGVMGKVRGAWHARCARAPATAPRSPPQVAEGSFIKRTLFNWGYKRKLHALNEVRTHEGRVRAPWAARDDAVAAPLAGVPLRRGLALL